MSRIKTFLVVLEYALMKNGKYSIFSTISRHFKISKEVNEKLEDRKKHESIVEEIPIIEDDNDIDYEQIKEIIPICDRLIAYLSEEDIIVGYRNLSTLYIAYPKEFNDDPFLYNKAPMGYNAVLNKINYRYGDIGSMSHEVIHVFSTSYYDKKRRTFTGFSQVDLDTSFEIGRGINEGYTTLIDERVFPENYNPETYKYEKRIAELVELFFEDPKDMQHLFFNHNLPGLIKKLEEYAEREEIISLLYKIDKITLSNSRHLYYINLYRNSEDVIFLPKIPLNFIGISAYMEVQLTLYKWFMTKCKDQERREKFINLLCEDSMTKTIIQKKKYKLYKDSPYEIESNTKKVT